MAALLLSFAGAAAGSSLFGPVGAIAGRIIGAVAGNVIDHALLGGTSRQTTGPRLADLDVMASSEGAPIPRVYGRVRISGQVIWATQLEEVVSTRTETSGGKGFGARASVSETTYSYFANFAVGLCEGTIGHIGRIWADGKPLDLSGITWRSYSGSEQQSADPLIVAKEGADNAPAYRGLAYVVFERLALEDFGNRIPQLSFEVIRPIGRLESMLRAVTLIPGTTEYGYDPQAVVRMTGPGQSLPENRHVAFAASDVEASLDELQGLCPNLERVAVVVAWFGDDLRAGHCVLKPGVEDATKVTDGAPWSAAGLDRASAHLVSTVDGRPAYGGTPSDDGVIRLIKSLKARGLKVTLYPFVMLDIPADNALPDPWTGAPSQPAYPWRGRITCDPAPGRAASPDGTTEAGAQVDALFGSAQAADYAIDGEQVIYAGAEEWTLRRMLLHYAALSMAAGGVDAFLLGSELCGLTRVRSSSGVYPAVGQLVTLAADVRAMLGPDVALTYGADWTEYGAHVVDVDAQEVRFPLDALWASDAINAVGIDYYAPLADWRDEAAHLDHALAESTYDRDYLAGNLAAGEDYDWYYADDAARAAQARSAITDGAAGKPWMFRVKDIWNWWANAHYDRLEGAELPDPTAWSPRSKPIWLTELGCPAVDKGANQPNVFPDPKSAESGVPHFSSGGRDDLIQRRVLEAVLGHFDPAFGADEDRNPVSPVYGGRMIDPAAVHVWTWDARPYPVFPAALDVWSDGANWETGHWITGRLGTAPLAELIIAILADAGITNVEAGALAQGPDGYVIDRPMAPRAAIDPLTLAFGFDAAEDGEILRFRQRGGLPVVALLEDDLVLDEDAAPAQLSRTQETELPREVSLAFSDIGGDFRRSAVTSRRLVGGSARASHADLAIVTDSAAAQRRAEIWLQDVWAGRERAEFTLAPSRLALAAGDVLDVTLGGRRWLLEVRTIVDAEDRRVSAVAVDPEIFSMPLAVPERRVPAIPASIAPVHVEVLELPTLRDENPPVLLRAALFAQPWPGGVAAWQSADGASFTRTAIAAAPAIIGETLDPLVRGALGVWDTVNYTRVRLYGGALASLNDMAVLAGGNAAAVRGADGAWEILQFAQAELVCERTYALSRLLRGQAGTEWAMADPLPAGVPFVLLDAHLVSLALGLEALGRPLQFRFVAARRDHADPSAVAISATPGATALKPLAPVHVRGERVGGDIRFSWIRRTRIGGDSWEASDVPLGEEREAYELDVLDGAAVKRTLASGISEAIYSAADEIADFGAPQAAVTVRVHQLSATVGRGIPAVATLTNLANP